MKIGLAAYAFENGDISFNLHQIEKAMAAVSGKADLLCFGETFLQGFDALTWQYERDKDVAVSQDSPVMEQLKALTVQYGVDLLFGYVERDGERIYSSCAVIERGALLHNYRRISRGWKEYDITDGHYCEGTSTAPFLYRGRTVMIALCGDLWDFPERFATDGLLIWPVYVNYDPEEWTAAAVEYAQQARLAARETLMVNSLSREPLPSYGGAFHFCDGAIAASVPLGRDEILIVEV